MTEHRSDPGERLEHSADELEEGLERLETHLDDAKERLRDREQDAQGPGGAES